MRGKHTYNRDIYLAEFIEGFYSVIQRLSISNVGCYIDSHSFFFYHFWGVSGF